MRVLGIDPGMTTGWCLYDASERRVVAAGNFREAIPDVNMPEHGYDTVVIERPKGYGPTRPQLVECGIVAGDLFRRIADTVPYREPEWMLRLDVCKALSEATHGEVRVRNDATAWAALKLLHGENCDKKGGALYGVKSHARAALAVSVAWALRQEDRKTGATL